MRRLRSGVDHPRRSPHRPGAARRRADRRVGRRPGPGTCRSSRSTTAPPMPPTCPAAPVTSIGCCTLIAGSLHLSARTPRVHFEGVTAKRPLQDGTRAIDANGANSFKMRNCRTVGVSWRVSLQKRTRPCSCCRDGASSRRSARASCNRRGQRQAGGRQAHVSDDTGHKMSRTELIIQLVKVASVS